MARIRSIKPEFWTSEQVMECSPNARLMFIGMWNFADDCGRLPCSPKSIKAQIFPSDDISLDTIRGMINELSSNGLLSIYSVEDKDYLQITGWSHQRIDKPQPAKYPAPNGDHSATVPRTLPPDRIGEDKKGKEKITRAASPSNEDFENFKRDYPKRAGQYGWKAAERKYLALVKTGVNPKMITLALSRFADEMRKLKRIGTEFIPMPASWLNSEDFVEYAVVAFEPKPVDWDALVKGYRDIGTWPTRDVGNDPMSPACKAPPEILRKYGFEPVIPALRAM
jgi:hypothetical protein